MEDISRELEREIARAKPSSYKVRKQKRILIIDDFGEFSSGAYLKVLIYVLFVISLLGVLGTAGLYFLFTQAQSETLELKRQLAVTQKKAHRLTGEKEILMARLVMAGEKPDLHLPVNPVVTGKQPGHPVSVSEPVPEKLPDTSAENNFEDVVVPAAPESVVSVEKFSVVQGKAREELIVRFNIRNISTQIREISGRIFTVLKSDPPGESVVVPEGIVENRLPGPYSKGQYFSITRFKPLRFTIKHQASADSFKTAAVYIFGEDGKLFFEDTIQINQAQ